MTALLPVSHINALGDIEMIDGRMVMAFESMGASVRLSLSRHNALMYYQQLGTAVIQMLKDGPPDCKVIPFSGEGDVQ